MYRCAADGRTGREGRNRSTVRCTFRSLETWQLAGHRRTEDALCRSTLVLRRLPHSSWGDTPIFHGPTRPLTMDRRVHLLWTDASTYYGPMHPFIMDRCAADGGTGREGRNRPTVRCKFRSLETWQLAGHRRTEDALCRSTLVLHRPPPLPRTDAPTYHGPMHPLTMDRRIHLLWTDAGRAGDVLCRSSPVLCRPPHLSCIGVSDKRISECPISIYRGVR